MALEDKEKEIIVQIKKYREGLSRNESKDQVLICAYKVMMRCGMHILKLKHVFCLNRKLHLR